MMESHVSDIGFDRAFAQELPAAEQQSLVAHVASCARCRERQSYLAEERAAFLDGAASSRAYTALRGRAMRARSKRALLWSLSAATALAAAFVLMPTRLAMHTGIRAKGGAQIGFYVKHGSQVTRGRPDQVVHPRDVLRFTYSSPEPTHFALLGRDDRHASLFYPRGNETIALEKGTDVALDFGVEIDGEPGQERIFALFCSKPAALSPLLAALEQSVTLPATDCVVRELRLRKAVP